MSSSTTFIFIPLIAVQETEEKNNHIYEHGYNWRDSLDLWSAEASSNEIIEWTKKNEIQKQLVRICRGIILNCRKIPWQRTESTSWSAWKWPSGQCAFVNNRILKVSYLYQFSKDEIKGMCCYSLLFSWIKLRNIGREGNTTSLILGSCQWYHTVLKQCNRPSGGCSIIFLSNYVVRCAG